MMEEKHISDENSQKELTDIENNINQKNKEPIYFNIIGKRYKGKMPTFYKNKEFELTKILEANYPQIKEEITNYYNSKKESFVTQYVPYKWKEEKWKVFTFFGFLLKYPKNLKEFPHLGKVLDKIPHLVTAQISVLEPHMRVKAHFAGSNALIRSHLAIVIPGTYPEIGFRIRQEERCWEEGKVLSFCESHPHYVWNYTDYNRIVLIIDTIHPDYTHKKYYISGGMLSMLTLKMFSFKFPILKKTPDWLTILIHRFFTFGFTISILLQMIFKFNIASILQKLKID